MTTYTERTLEFYDLLLTDFPAAVEKYITQDTIWENPLPEIIPFGGVYQGPEGLGQYLQMIMAELEMKPLHFGDIIESGRIVSAIGDEKDTLVKRTGKRYDMPCVHVIRFDADGKVAHIREYNDITQMLLAFQS
ncbi:MAG: nuclear transport factor 2 family protein [Pseudomonadales bacterium]